MRIFGQLFGGIRVSIQVFSSLYKLLCYIGFVFNLRPQSRSGEDSRPPTAREPQLLT